MKNIKTAVAALLIAGGTIGVFAFTKANRENKAVKADQLHWFDASTGNYLGERTEALEQQNCGTPGNIDCAYGYELDQNGEPIPSTQVTVKKQ